MTSYSPRSNKKYVCTVARIMTSYSPPHDFRKQYNSSKKKKSRNIHHEIAVDAKCPSVQRFGEKSACCKSDRT